MRDPVLQSELDHDLHGTRGNIIPAFPEVEGPIKTLFPILYTCLKCHADDVPLDRMVQFNALGEPVICNQCFEGDEDVCRTE